MSEEYPAVQEPTLGGHSRQNNMNVVRRPRDYTS